MTIAPIEGVESLEQTALKPKALISGAGGFIGSHLTEHLLQQGHAVRGLLMPEESDQFLAGLAVETVRGDIKRRQSLEMAVEGIDTIYHLAAISLHDARLPDSEYIAVNIEGTRNLLNAAVAAGVKRFLYTATIEAVGLSQDGKPLTEESEQRPRNIYGRTKMEAEKLVLDYAKKKRIETIVVRPPMIYGPREFILLRRLFKIIALGFYPLIGSGRALTEFCYVKNQVHGIALAAARGTSGSIYFISDERPYTIEEIVSTIAAELGTHAWTPHLPVPIAKTIGASLEILNKLLPFYPFRIPQTGRPPFSRKTVEWTAESRLYVDISKAREELGYRPAYSLSDGVQETIAWYRERGYLPPRDR
jgi:UDP-glucose 4-epimerase